MEIEKGRNSEGKGGKWRKDRCNEGREENEGGVIEEGQVKEGQVKQVWGWWVVGRGGREEQW